MQSGQPQKARQMYNLFIYRATKSEKYWQRKHFVSILFLRLHGKLFLCKDICFALNYKIYNTMKNLGIILIVIGAFLLVLTVVPFMADFADQNWYTVGSLILIVIGLIAHIIINKRIY